MQKFYLKKTEFVLCPSRHSHPSIDGLPSVFKETQDIFNLGYTDEFKSFCSESSVYGWSHKQVNVYVTGLTPALDKFLKKISSVNYRRNEEYSNYSDLSVVLFHYDRSQDKYRTI